MNIPPLYANGDPQDVNDEIPPCFIRGTSTPEEARRRWQKTKEWRVAKKVDEILEIAHPNFLYIKERYPHALHKIGSKGMYIYIERPGHGRLAEVWSAGLTLDDMEQHYTFTTEYLWRVLEPREDAQFVSVFDIDNCSMSDLTGDTFSMLKRCSQVIGQHYPERAHKIFVVNAPGWVSWIWSTITPFLDPITTKKISIIKKGKDHIKEITEFCDVQDLPPEIGGSDSIMLGHSEAEQGMLAFVKTVNEKHNVPTEVDSCRPMNK
ncbi:CRAL/TRIO domain protein [Gregarina niphandrodes]|uniref:CRAL/TRIO domain protein n=1 Tax=Gregarina niphandrodes TaxID=110365 RepID=A0A023B273_GRENI|nr:CRAL/TRIO domain protein [Gregarina niphandrodes]EZG51417.1 CRAL/TRIO domain protein [Gregarina niphandrodes]|eukprot:XP_011131972.1 CRAL/TRIO domain protein [Gregarina niphandrodes]